MKRKAIQITALDQRGVIVALCDDGTVWQYDASATWSQCTPIPQDAPPEFVKMPIPGNPNPPMFEPHEEDDAWGPEED